MSLKEKLRLLFITSRPISWVNTAYPFAAGYLLTGGSIDTRFVVASLFFLIPYNLLMYGVNDVYDYESDIKNPRKGGIEGGITPKSQHTFLLASAYLLCVPFVIYLWYVSSPSALLTLLVVLFFVIAYSIKGLRFKEIPLLDSFTSSMHFVGPLLYAIALHGFPSFTWPYVIGFFLWGLASHAFGAVQDIIPDREARIGSIATVLGARKTVWFALLCYTTASVLVSLQGGYALVVGLSGFAYVANVAPYLNINDTTSEHARRGWKRFLWINYIMGTIITISLIASWVF